MKSLFRIALLAIAMATTHAMAAPATVGKSDKGDVLVNGQGMTLYTFDNDMQGMSMCEAQCATNWPALKADSGSSAEGDWTTVKRSDGSLQWAYKGKPLYTWAKDSKAGDTTGDNVKNVWHVAKP